MPGALGHLIRRFFDVLFARRLTSSERAAIDGWLREGESTLFYSQPVPDQRHGYHAALSVVTSGVGDTSTIRAALLHDVGKRHSRLGIIGRSVASILLGVGAPLTRRMGLYRDHGVIGADELRELGCEPLVVEFALHHHGDRPDSINHATWKVLKDADS